MENRWVELLPSPAPVEDETSEIAPDVDDALVGAAHPQLGLDVPDGNGLGEVFTDDVCVHWVGTHGGSGESTLETWLGGRACGHRWPRATPGSEATVATVLVARRTHNGMASASAAARQWAAGAVPGVNLLGLALIEDAPGKVPRELQRQAKVLSGAVPRTWILPWIEDLRVHGEADPASLSHAATRTLASLREVVEEHTPAQKRNV